MSQLHPGEWVEQRVALFVDTQNLYHSARDNYGGHVNYETLLERAVRGRRLAQATAYVVEREGDSTSYGFITKLTVLGYRVSRRKLRVHHTTDSGQPLMEGDWDMGIAMDIIRALGSFDVLALASGDGDFTPLLRYVQDHGKRTEVLAFRETASQELLDRTDRFVSLTDEPLILLSQRTA